jgi:hypothetical protein
VTPSNFVPMVKNIHEKSWKDSIPWACMTSTVTRILEQLTIIVLHQFNTHMSKTVLCVFVLVPCIKNCKQKIE